MNDVSRRFQHLALAGIIAIALVGQIVMPSALADDPAPPAPPKVSGNPLPVGPIGGPALAPAPAVPPLPVPSGSDSSNQTAGAPADADPAAIQPAPEPTAEATAQPTYQMLPGGTTISPERFYSPILGQSTWYEVILPPGYDRTNRRYPVLYMLHGAMGGASEWAEIGIHRAADELWSEGQLEPFIIVLPEGGMMNYWLNHANGGPRYGDYLVEDVVDEIDTHYRTLSDPRFRAIGGLSMGGDGALRVALTRPDVFTIAGAHSPTTRLRYEDRPGAFYGDFGYWQQNNPLWLIRNNGTADRLQIWVDIGEDDPWVSSARELHQALLDQDVDHAYAELPGTHEAEYWEANQSDYLRFYSQAFANSQALADRPVPSDTAGE